MSFLLESAVKTSLVLGLAMLILLCLRHRSAALRHWVLATAIGAALATPALMLLPSWSLPVPASAPAADREVRSTIASVTTPQIPSSATPLEESSGMSSVVSAIQPSSLLLPLWIAGVVMNLSGLLLGLWRLRRVASQSVVVSEGPWAEMARPIASTLGLRREVRLLQSDQGAVLVTWGWLAPKVLLPAHAESWSPERMRVVLAHELAHIRRGDWGIQMAGELLRMVYWFNPLVWLAASRLRLESERACDDHVVNLGVPGRDYAVHLLELARAFGHARKIPVPAVAIVPRPSSLQRRIAAMLNARLSRRPVTRLARLGTFAAMLVAAVPIALFAQNTFTTVSGSIVDESAAVLPGVVVVALDRDRGIRHEVHTDRSGRFELTGLPQGRYTLEAELPGFQTFAQQLTLSGEDVHRDITLPVGIIEELVAVTNSGPSDGPGPPPQRASPRPVTCGSDSARAAAPAPRANGTLRVGGQIRSPRKLYHVAPIYPVGAEDGTVRMDAVIDTNGFIRDTTVLSGPPVLAQSAVEAVRRWEFEPTLLNCVPVEVRMSVVVDFR
jgi:beta-lactamase regulating signal transducer with metallopeptidase domain